VKDRESCNRVVRWLKFNVVGAIGIGVQLGVLALLISVGHCGYLMATAVAVETSVLHNFLWHERFTWADRAQGGWRSVLRRLLCFNAANGLVSVAGNLVLMRFFVGEAHLPPILANLVSISWCALLNFVVSDRWVFQVATQE